MSRFVMVFFFFFCLPAVVQAFPIQVDPRLVSITAYTGLNSNHGLRIVVQVREGRDLNRILNVGLNQCGVNQINCPGGVDYDVYLRIREIYLFVMRNALAIGKKVQIDLDQWTASDLRNLNELNYLSTVLRRPVVTVSREDR